LAGIRVSGLRTLKRGGAEESDHRHRLLRARRQRPRRCAANPYDERAPVRRTDGHQISSTCCAMPVVLSSPMMATGASDQPLHHLGKACFTRTFLSGLQDKLRRDIARIVCSSWHWNHFIEQECRVVHLDDARSRAAGLMRRLYAAAASPARRVAYATYQFQS